MLYRLKTEYIACLKKLGTTGAGLDPFKIMAGSAMANVISTFLIIIFSYIIYLNNSIEEIEDEWLWWNDLHAFWRELPNYNPVGVESSEPRFDHAAAAEGLFGETQNDLGDIEHTTDSDGCCDGDGDKADGDGVGDGNENNVSDNEEDKGDTDRAYMVCIVLS